MKSLNHVGYHDLEEHAQASGAPDRRALGVAGDGTAAMDSVAELVDRLGFDPVRVGGLSAGRILQPGGPVFGIVLAASDCERTIGTPPMSSPGVNGSRARLAQGM